MLGHEEQMLIVNAFCHTAEMTRENLRYAAGQYERPCVLFRPKLTIDGDQWCALYGENLQEGVAGFGKSPVDAMADFDRNWEAKLK